MKQLVLLVVCGILILSSCDNYEIIEPLIPEPGVDVVYLPVVVHVIHEGEDIGQGSNLSDERIRRQIEILNEDFRRKPGTRGYNDHPSSADAKIEFVLARRTPDGAVTTGIHRINATQVDVDNFGYTQNYYAQFAYWDPTQYINIWTTPLPASAQCVVLGSATGPETDLPGTELLQLPRPDDAEGILVNWVHFGESDIDCHARFGRTLTHEMGHYLGLLHTWGDKKCASNDFCADTPAVDTEVFGRHALIGCNGEPVMLGNYMNYTDDEVMNIFTKDQIARMHYVLEHHKGRNALLSSPAHAQP